MTSVQDVCDFLERFAPCRLAEEWDNVGLLVGDSAKEIHSIMTCLTVTPASAGEAVRESAELIVTHHPLPFRSLKRITTESLPGRLLWQLIRSGISIHSPHTAFDSAARGINQRLAEGLELRDIQPLITAADAPERLGAGRWGHLGETQSLIQCAERVKRFLLLDGLQMVGSPQQEITRVAVACGSAGSFLDAARQQDCQLLLTGETSFHVCLEAEAQGIALLLPGHFASERFAVEALSDVLLAEFPQLRIWPSRSEADPLRWV